MLRALVLAAGALGGVALPAAFDAGATAFAQTPGAAPQNVAATVQLHILVIEASKEKGPIDPRLESLKDNMLGYTAAKVVDEVSAKADEGSSVSMEIVRKSKEPRLLKVTVLKVTPDKNITMKVAIDAIKFSAEPTHKSGSTFLLGHKLPNDKALFLAVTPKVP